MRRKLRFTLRGMLLLLTLSTLAASHVYTSYRLRETTRQLSQLRRESGYIDEPDQTKLVAVRVPSDVPLSWKFRVRTPPDFPYAVHAGTFWPQGNPLPEWYNVHPLPEGESLVTVRLLEDPRDKAWKIITLVRHQGNTQRMSRPLTDRQVQVFCSSHNTIRGGIVDQVSVSAGQTLRVIDEKLIGDEGGLMLYGSGPPNDDIDGIFAWLRSNRPATATANHSQDD